MICRRSGFSTFASALLLLLSVPQISGASHFVYAKKGYSLDYPDGWNVDRKLLDVDGPLELTSFPAGGYIHSGFLPPGGIDINVQVLPATTDEELVLMRGAASVTNLTRSVHDIHGRRVLRADYDHDMSGGASDRATIYRTTSTCVRVEDKLFTILIQYAHTPPDPAETARAEAALAQIVSSLSTATTK
jgi:hypothetical protein